MQPLSLHLVLTRVDIPNKHSLQGQKLPTSSSNQPLPGRQLPPQSGVMKHHFGMLNLVRTFIALAFRRRNMSLLGKTAEFAGTMGLNMDAIMSDMKFLPSIVLLPLSQQDLGSRPLSWSDIPRQLITAVGLANMSKAKLNEQMIMVRRVHNGCQSLFLSAAFDRDVVSWKALQHAWVSNTNEPYFQNPAESAKIALQLMNLRKRMKSEDTVQICQFRSKIFLVNKGRATQTLVSLATPVSVKNAPLEEIEIEVLLSLFLPSLDTTFVFLQFVRVATLLQLEADLVPKVPSLKAPSLI